MDPRYQHPRVTELYGPERTYSMWWTIEQAVAQAQREQIALDPDKQQQFREMAVITDNTLVFDEEDVQAIAAIEARTKHDVAAFLEFVRKSPWIGEQSGRWVHFGLTSSDVVDTAQALRFKWLEPQMETALLALQRQVNEWCNRDQAILGRTHGEPAEPMTIGMRARHWLRMLNSAGDRLQAATGDMQFAKTSGPVGSYAHNGPWIESRVAQQLGLASHGPGASQIIPRVNLANWASCASQVVSVCAKIAMDVRLMLLLGEGYLVRPADQVGSSSMAHKTNPIRAEKITGLQRVAAAYASMLQPLDLWLERDISNSSVERIAVPDLWHVLLHVMGETYLLLDYFNLRIEATLAIGQAGGKPYVSRATLEAIRAGHSASYARAEALAFPLPPSTEQHPEAWFFRNWPEDGELY